MTPIASDDECAYVIAFRYFEIISFKASGIMKNWNAFISFLKLAITGQKQ